MIHGHVIGELWSTQKVQGLEGTKLLIVRPSGGTSSDGLNNADVVAVDLVGAGCGDRVLVALGRAARIATRMSDEMPIEAAIIGVVDDVNIRSDLISNVPPAAVEISDTKSTIASPRSEASADATPLPNAPSEALPPSAESKTRVRTARKAKDGKPRTRKEKRDTGTPAEKTDDLFGADSPNDAPPRSESAVAAPETTLEYDPVADLPGFADADEIWREVYGDDNDEDRNE